MVARGVGQGTLTFHLVQGDTLYSDAVQRRPWYNSTNNRVSEERMSLTIDSKGFQEIQRQHSLGLFDHLSFLSTALKEVRAQKRLLRDQKFALLDQLHAITQQQQTLSHEESTLLQEETAILARFCGQ